MARQKALDVRRTIRTIRDSLAEILADPEKCGPAAARILRALDDLEPPIETRATPPEATMRAGAPRKAGKRNKPKRYAFAKVRGEEMLAEYRADNRVPFYCPKPVLDAVVHVFAKRPSPLSFDEIRDGAAARLREPPAEFQIRVCLRFLGDSGAKLIKRRRARYIAESMGSLLRQAASAWRAMALTGGGGIRAGHDR